MRGAPVAVVTGAGSGLGRVITLTLAAHGWRVAAAGRRPLPLEETAALAAGLVVPVPADVGQVESVAALFGAVADRFGRLDLLVNNAGTFAPGGHALPRPRLDRKTPSAAADGGPRPTD